MTGNTYFQNGIGNRLAMLVGVVIFALFFSGCDVKKPKVFRVGIISGADFFLSVVDGFKTKMTELGYVQHENIVYDVIKLNIDPAGEQQAAKKFVDDNVDLIFTVPTESTVAAQAATRGTNIPVVFAYAGLEGANLVKSVRAPGGNITGVRFPGPDITVKRLEILLELVPGIKRVWIGYDKNYPNTLPSLKALRPVAVSKEVTLVEVPAATIGELEADLAMRAKSADLGLDAIILMPDTFNHSPAGWTVIKNFAAKHRVPLGGSFLYTVKQGAIFGNANNLFKVGELAAPLADKVFKGIPVGEIPVVTPDQDLWINYKVAQELGLTIPEGWLSMAAKIIR